MPFHQQWLIAGIQVLTVFKNQTNYFTHSLLLLHLTLTDERNENSDPQIWKIIPLLRFTRNVIMHSERWALFIKKQTCAVQMGDKSLNFFDKRQLVILNSQKMFDCRHSHIDYYIRKRLILSLEWEW